MNNNISFIQLALGFASFSLIMLLCAIVDGSMGGALVAIGFVALGIIMIAIVAFINHIKSQR